MADKELGLKATLHAGRRTRTNETFRRVCERRSGGAPARTSARHATHAVSCANVLRERLARTADLTHPRAVSSSIISTKPSTKPDVAQAS